MPEYVRTPADDTHLPASSTAKVPPASASTLVALQRRAGNRAVVLVVARRVVEIESFDLTSLRTGIMAGAPCPVEVLKQVRSRMHIEEITIACGMTETAPLSTQPSVDDPVEKRVTTVGRVHPHVEVKIVDPKTGATVPRGTPGEQCTRGYGAMIGYWNDASGTAAAIDADGWMHSGDLAVMDDEGYLSTVGRIKDMIIRGGENIYPREVEEFLYRLPEIDQVEVIGVPSERYGEEVMAWVRLRDGVSVIEADLVAACRGRIATYKSRATGSSSSPSR